MKYIKCEGQNPIMNLDQVTSIHKQNVEHMEIFKETLLKET